MAVARESEIDGNAAELVPVVAGIVGESADGDAIGPSGVSVMIAVLPAASGGGECDRWGSRLSVLRISLARAPTPSTTGQWPQPAQDASTSKANQ